MYTLGQIDDIIDSVIRPYMQKLNDCDRLLDWIQSIDIDGDYSEEESDTRKIIVIGESEIAKDSIISIVSKNLGIEKKFVEVIDDYNKAKSTDINKFKNNNYRAIIVGPIPHNTKGVGQFASAISKMENDPDFPPVYRCGNGQLKISKNALTKTMKQIKESE